MDRDNFHRCMVWLWEHKPKTLLLNLRAIPTHTCLKDLLSLLTFAMHSRASGDPALAVEGALAGKRKAKEHKAAIRTKAGKRQRRVARRDRRLSLKEVNLISKHLSSKHLVPVNSLHRTIFISIIQVHV